MRRKLRRTTEQTARELLAQARTVHLASSTPDGIPVIRALNAVLIGDRLLFHGAFAGEKNDCLGRPAVASAIREIAEIPSYFTEPQKACPATSYYRSVQAHGALQDITSLLLKAEMLEALMQKYQPEGGYAPLSPPSTIYERDLRSTRVFALAIERIVGKANLGQDQPPERLLAVVAGLWKRGRTEDLDAIREILEESPHPWPEAFYGPPGVELLVAPRGDELDQAAELLVGQYWRGGSTRDDILRSLREGSVWVGARDTEGKILGSARALTDTAWMASIHDVVVHPDYRGRGIGHALVSLLLDHPRLRDCAEIRLGTADRQHFYGNLGFYEACQIERGFTSTPMVRLKPHD